MENYDFALHAHRHILTHGQNVALYCNMLFMELEKLHSLDDEWLDILLLAAKYHDIGAMDGPKSHHKNSYHKIIHDQTLPIEDSQREMVALLARYHRKSLPSHKHPEFVKMPKSVQENICQGAAILRLADALDYGHQGLIHKINAKIYPQLVLLTCHSHYDITNEMFRVIKKSNLFARTFKKEIQCRQA